MSNFLKTILLKAFFELSQVRIRLGDLALIVAVLSLTTSCSKGDDLKVPRMAPITENISAVTPPDDFNPSRCYGVWNFPPDKNHGWFSAKINGEWLGGVATLIEFPEGTERYRFDYLMFDYAGDCAGSYSGHIGDLSLQDTDPYKELVRKSAYRNCTDSNGRRLFIQPSRPYRHSSFFVLDYDARIQNLLTDTTETGYTQIEFDQVDLAAGFVRGRFAGRFYGDLTCPEGTVKIGEHIVDEILLEEGYFETYIPE